MGSPPGTATRASGAIRARPARAVASGVYVSVLESSHGRSSHKLTLVR